MDEQRLADLVMRDGDFSELERALDIFCPFEAVGMVRQEIRHAHFLAYVLDPNRPHGFGDTCLRAFLTLVVEARREGISGGGSSSALFSLDIHLMNLGNVTLRREWRHIDLLIEVPEAQLVVAVELKIDASEGDGQLARYPETVKLEHPGWRHLFVFLTKSGEEPSDGHAETWLTLGLGSVAEALRRVAVRPGGDSGAKIMLLAYLDMLGRHHLNDDRLEQLAADLWKRHREALEFLADRQPNALSEAMRLLSQQKDEIAAEIGKAANLKVVFDSESGTTHLRFAVEDWDILPDLQGKAEWTATKRFILLEVSRGPETIKAYVQLGRGDTTVRERIYRRLKKSGAQIKFPDRFSAEWKRLASHTLLKLKDDDDRDPVDLVKKLRAELVKMATTPLIEYDKALRSTAVA